MEKELGKGDENPHNYEGQLLKFTNVVKGLQFRWFVINNSLGLLEYYEKEEHKKTLRPRGHISLIFAEVVPSVEDSNTFIINAKTGSTFKLKAFNTKERQEWMNNLRRSIQYFNKKFENGRFYVLGSGGSLRNKHDADSRSSMGYHNSPVHSMVCLSGADGSNHLSSQSLVQYNTIRDDLGMDFSSRSNRDPVPFHDELIFSREPFKNVNCLIDQMEELHASLSKDIESLPTSGCDLTFCDKNLLLSKATSAAAIDSLKKCVVLLKNQKIIYWKFFNRRHKPESAAPTAIVIARPLVVSSGHDEPVTSGSVSSLPAAIGTAVNTDTLPLSIGGLTAPGCGGAIDDRATDDTDEFMTMPGNLVSAQSNDELTSQNKLAYTRSQDNPPVMMGVAVGSNNLLLPIDGMDTWPSNPIDLTRAVPDPGSDEEVDLDTAPINDRHKTVIQHLISQVKLGMDLTKVTLPTFILERRSLLEMFSDFMAHPQLFLRINEENTPEKRIRALVIWYLTAFHAGKKSSVAKKPYNPIIGESFHCMWHIPDEEGGNSSVGPRILNNGAGVQCCSHVHYTAEQVSHHPPVTAFQVDCPRQQMQLSAAVHTRSKFHGMSVSAQMLGSLCLSLRQHQTAGNVANGEQYLFTLPNAHARNLLSVPKLELGDKVTLSSPTTKYSASIVFHSKPLFGNSPVNRISGEIKDPDNKIFIKISGDWNSHIELQDIRTDEVSVIRVAELQVHSKHVNQAGQQRSHESRRLWHHVTEALKSGDIESATRHKSELEIRQRQSEKQRLSRKLPFPVKYFQASGGGGPGQVISNPESVTWSFRRDLLRYQTSCPHV